MKADTLVLSIFPGMIDMQGRALEELGYCVVRGPDLLWGGDNRKFFPPRGVFAGVIGGDPCQSHMRLAHLNRALGREPRFPDLTPEFCRIVECTGPDWWLRENVPDAPDPVVDGYVVHKLRINNRHVGGIQSRDRCFWYGTRVGRRLDVEVNALDPFEYESAIIGGNGGGLLKWGKGGRVPDRSIERIKRDARRPISLRLELQGLPADFFDHAPFTDSAKKRILANAPPMDLCRAIARAVHQAREPANV